MWKIKQRKSKTETGDNTISPPPKERNAPENNAIACAVLTAQARLDKPPQKDIFAAAVDGGRAMKYPRKAGLDRLNQRIAVADEMFATRDCEVIDKSGRACDWINYDELDRSITG